MSNIFKKAFTYFKKNYVTSDTPGVTKAGKRSDSSKQSDAKVNQKLLRDYFLSDPVIRSSVQTNVDNICTGYDFELKEDTTEAEEQKKRAEELFYRDNFMEKWRNIQMCLEVYDDSFQETQIYIADDEIVFDSFIVETPSIRIKNKKNGEIDNYVQYLDGKKVAKIAPKDLIHYRFNVFGDRDHGLSLLSTVMYSSAIRKFIEKYNAAIFANHKPRGVWIFPGEMPEEIYNDNVDLIIEGKNDPNKDLFLRGSGVEYKNFLDQTDVDFQKGYVEARNEIIIGLGVPPIFLGIPEGSNKSNSDTQMQAYDRRVRAKQNSFAYKINTELLKKLGLDLIKFVPIKSSKRDEERELNIVNKMKGLVSLNEARKQIGFPELDPDEFPEADKIWTDGSIQVEAEAPEKPEAKVIKKSVQVKKKVKTPKVLVKEENKALTQFKRYYNQSIDMSKKYVDLLVKDGKFKKALSAKDLEKDLEALFKKSKLDLKFSTFALGKYMTTGKKVSKDMNKKFIPNNDEIKFIKNYNFDQVKVQSQKEINQIKQIMEVGLVNNQSATIIKQALEKVRKTSINNAATLVRTEMNRANNMGSLQSMKKAGVKTKKYLVITHDKRTSPISKALGKKYGTEAQAIDLEKDFIVVVKGKTIRGPSPPFHISDRDVLVYTIE